MNLYKSLRVFSFNVLNALDNTEIFSASVFFHSEQAAGIHIVWMDVNDEVLEVSQFCLAVVVIAQKLFYKLRFSLF